MGNNGSKKNQPVRQVQSPVYRSPQPVYRPQAQAPSSSNAVVAYRPQPKPVVARSDSDSDTEIGIIARQQIGVGAVLQMFFTTLVLDCSGSMAGGKWRAVLNGVNMLLSQMKDIDMVGAVTFSDKVQTISSLQAKGDTDVLKQLGRVAVGGGTHLYEAIMEGLQLSLAGNLMTPDAIGQVRIKHTMIVLTDGEDTGSRISLQQTCEALRQLPDGLMNIVFIGIGLDRNSKANLQSLANACGDNGSFQDVGCSAEEIASVFDHVALVLSRRVDIMGVAIRQGDGGRRVNA